MAVYTTIDNPELYFQTKLYTGTGSEIAATLDGDEDMQPDLVWIKARTDTESHKLYDSVRGVTKDIESDLHAAEGTDAQGLKSFDSDGFTIGTYSSINANSSHDYVAWCWKESATAGFDIVSYTGTGSAKTEAHSLSAVPKFIAVKNRTTARTWINGHTSIGWEKNLYFDMDNAQNDSADMWNDTDPTSSVFTVGTSVGVNENTDSIIAYLWTDIQGYSKFGSYTGNGNADGPMVVTGMRPAFLMCKRTDSTDNWVMVDNKRDTFNLVDERLFADLNQAEGSQDVCDFTANGFKVKTTSTWINASGGTYIYMAFAEAPFVNSNGVPCNAR